MPTVELSSNLQCLHALDLHINYLILQPRFCSCVERLCFGWASRLNEHQAFVQTPVR